MAPKEFMAKLSPTSQKRQWPAQSGLSFLLATQLKVPTLVVGGALLQILLFTVLPTRWAVLPACILALNSVVSTFIQARSPRSNPYMKDVILGRTTAQLPRQEDGRFGGVAANRPLVVFMVGIQFNHPLGFLAPGGQEVIAFFRRINKDLQEHRQEYGILSMSNDWKATNRDSLQTMGNTYYFKDIEGLHKFAHGPVHREAWDWYQPKKWPHLGVYHEVFEVSPQSYENVYVNCQPLLMGRSSVECDTMEGKMQVNALVSADTPALKTMYSRMRRDEDGIKK